MAPPVTNIAPPLPSSASREERMVVTGVGGGHSCNEHASKQIGDMARPNSDVHESVHDKEQKGMYGPWIMVERKRIGTK